MEIQNVKSKLASALLVVAVFTGVPAMAYQAVTPATPASQGISAAGVLSFAEMEKRALVEIPDIREMEVRGLLLEVEGYDSQGRKVKLLMDRRSGDVLSHRVKQHKHAKQPARGN